MLAKLPACTKMYKKVEFLYVSGSTHTNFYTRHRLPVKCQNKETDTVASFRK